MKTPSRSPILAAAAAFLLSTCALDKKPESVDNPVPPVPADVRAKGADAVVQWLLDGDYLEPDDLREFIGDKARQATSEVREAAEGADKNPLLAKLRSGYESLPATAFKVGIKPTWETVVAKLTPDVLAKANKLESPRIYGVNGSGELLIGDGGNNVPNFTLRQNYSQARSAAQATGLALMTEDEYRSFNDDGFMEVNVDIFTWLESGDAPVLALYGFWNGNVSVSKDDPEASDDFLGARRVLRVKL